MDEIRKLHELRKRTKKSVKASSTELTSKVDKIDDSWLFMDTDRKMDTERKRKQSNSNSTVEEQLNRPEEESVSFIDEMRKLDEERKRVKENERYMVDNLLNNVVSQPPGQYIRPPTIIPFHVPHKKLLEKIEYKKVLPEPLTGFQETQKRLMMKKMKFFEGKPDEVKPEEILKEKKIILYAPGSKKNFDIVDQNAIINELRNTKNEGLFLYMVYSVSRSSEYFTPYTLKLVKYDEINKCDFLTISKRGVLQTYGKETIFTSLGKWEYEFNMYCKLKQFRTFSHFRIWKAFFIWKKKICWDKITNTKKFLTENLFILNPILREALLNLQAMCVKFFGVAFTNLTCTENYYFFYFIEDQLEQLEMLAVKLQEFRTVVKDLVNNACHGALLEHGFTTDDRSFYAQFIGKRRRKIEGEPRMSYMELAKKKRFCIRLSCFITLVDYMVIKVLHLLIYNAITGLLDLFRKHVNYLPDEELLNGTDINVTLEEPRAPIDPKLPFFLVNAVVNKKQLNIDPNEQIMVNVLTTLMNMWTDIVNKVNMYLPDPFFKPFLHPLINGKVDDRICGFGPRVQFYLTNDENLNEKYKGIFELLHRSFETSLMYMKRFEYVQKFYAEDVTKTAESIEKERSLEELRGMCKRYHYEVEELNKIVDSQPLGLFNIQFQDFKNTALPQPLRLIEILNNVLPIIGHEKVEFLMEESEAAQIYLETEPQSTIDYVKYLEFVDAAQAKVDDMEIISDYTKEIYDIIEEFHIVVAPEDMTQYLGVSVTLGTLRSIVDKKAEERGKIILKFNEQCNKDITKLINDIGKIKEECMEPWLIDIESTMEEAKAALDDLYKKIMECSGRANEYKSYQKQFRVEVSRFEFLEEVINDIKLRMLLWDSMEIWYRTVEEWYQADFNTIDVEEMNAFTARSVKNIAQLEKGLPRNLIVPKLKEDVATMKDKLPIVGYLRNPSLRQRHWMRIEQILNYKFKVEEVITLKFLEDLHCFTFPNEFMELSAQASSEASLELMLKKVEESWKALEFIIMPHRDVKDVYVLGTLEDVQQVLDDSNITMSTICSSKHVGPIKPRVDEWVKLLDNFSKTLDEWQLCQQNWIYLEIIFSAPDIQRQLPQEAKLFTVVDKSWKEIMRRTQQMPLAMEAASYPGLLDALKRNNAHLEQILKCLEAYLETKRVAFPRFYFLSNEELLDVLAQTRNPFAVQPHLRKCFDAIAKLEFGTRAAGEGDEETQTDAPVMTTDIMAMISPEGERVGLTKGLKARGNVEDWLRKVEDGMFIALKKLMRKSLDDYKNTKRDVWVKQHPNQIILTVWQIMWAKDVHRVLDGTANKLEGMKQFEKVGNAELNMFAGLTRTDLTPIFRKVLVALITISVHARDTISSMVTNRVQKSSDFEWLKMLRYYWLEDIDDCSAKMSSAEYVYGYEYLGASGVLVITPLTDKCYLCLMGALQLDLGGAPAGPAGTGKTETTKDLAKALAIQCVVFNCSDGLDYKMMGRFFSGLAQSGAWCCFDEFNRIDIEVLSVIAQQLITIRNAKAAKAKRFMFEGREIKLVQTCAAFITMNPGYAGRTELPDNLKALFRPISMMVPDYGLIAEVTLYSEGFESSKVLAQKMVNMYKLCSEQLSQQDHYDFGMRAVKSVLVMAGALKRANPDKNEDVVLIRALRDSNIPKFLTDDALLFSGILGDLFPGVEVPEQDYGILQTAMETVILENGLQIVDKQITKVIQLFETMIVRWGVMLVGPTGGGKTTVLNILKNTLTKLHEDEVPSPYYQPVHTYVLNPKSITAGELYGEVNLHTMEWRDGLLAICVRKSVQSTNEDHQWVICDGPVDAVWIENLNTVLDDNKMLCLANSERIKLTPYVHMVFEVMDLAAASPATVSRCGMVYIDPEELKWFPYVQTWATKLGENYPNANQEVIELILHLFTITVETSFVYARKYCEFSMHQVDIGKVDMMCKLFESIITQPGGIDKMMNKLVLRTFIIQTFVFSCLWSIGGNLVDYSREKLESHVRDQYDEVADARLPNEDLFSVYMNITSKRLEPWARIVPSFKYDPATPFFEMIVPTSDTLRFGYILERLIYIDKPVLFTGDTGVGKSVIAKVVLNQLYETGKFVPVTLNFSAQTSSAQTQVMIELKLEKKKKNLLGAPPGKKLILFVDDVNMPKLETYGAQPPIELLRQFLDFGGLYDREKMFWKTINDLVIIAACAPPGGGRNPLTPRFVRHFGMLLISPPNEYALKAIFRAIMKGFLDQFATPVRDLCDSMVAASVDIYEKIAEDLLPTPAKSHYVFNLRDLSKCVQGVLQADSGIIIEAQQMLRLFYHECLRVFHDRLINVEDKSYFYYLMREVCNRNFGTPVIILPDEAIIQNPPVLLFGDFLVFGAAPENKYYEEVQDVAKLRNVLQDYLDDYNISTPKEMKIIFFMDAIEHLMRIARILRAERGNALLVGVGGMGKQSLTKLASHVNSYKCGQIELVRNYDHVSFFEDIRKFYFTAGAENENMVFLFTDTQIVEEEFLEDINNILNSGDVPNLFEADEYEKVMNALRPICKDFGVSESNRDAIYEFFISRVRKNLHLSLCMSPVGDAFRRRCRMFPSLVNCCTIDWFVKWPEEALFSVALNSLENLGSPDFVERLGTVCVIIHKSVEDMSLRYYNEMRRYFYTTPSSYLDLLKQYNQLLETKKKQTESRKNRIGNGLTKLYETNEMIDNMKEMLKELAPQLEEKSIAVAELLVYLEKEQAKADVVKQYVKADEEAALEKAAESQALADDAQADLATALPAMEAAVKALESLNKNDINELKVFQKPPQLVRTVMEAVCLLMGIKTDWASAKQLLADTNFLKRLQDYDKDSISDIMLKKLRVYVDNPSFVPEIVATQSKVCKSICMWVRAIDTYAKVYRVVEPKRKKQQAAETELNQVMTVLREKQKKLADVIAYLESLQAQFEASVQEKQDLEDGMILTSQRLVRAGRLTMALGDEQIRWEEGVKNFNIELSNMVGDVLMAAACVAYLGAFTSNYREELTEMWLQKCKYYNIPCSDSFSLITILADQYEIRSWNTWGLPRDNVSTENAILVTKSDRWPLMIDPQEQANRWIRQMEIMNQLQIVKLTDANFLRTFESSIRLGFPVLLEELGEQLDPTLEPILLKQTFISAGRLMIRLGDSDVDYDRNFKLYMTTKLPNPHYLPEICIKVTLVNFTVTLSGLEDQLLADVVRLERPDLEQQRNELIIRINNDKAQLNSIEEKILYMLFYSEGNILDDEVLIETLNESKETSAIIASRLIETEATEQNISVAREKYRSVAIRGSVLYFVVARLADIDPMYQFSLKYFKQIFNLVIETSEKHPELEARLEILYREITFAIYVNVSRGLFERHKLIFSFMLCVDIMKKAELITESEWNFLLRGPVGVKAEIAKKPDVSTLSENMWVAANFLAETFKVFAKLIEDVLTVISVTVGDFTQVIKVAHSIVKLSKTNWNEALNDFQKLMLIKCLQEEKLVFLITEFVKVKMGKAFVESPQVSLHLLYQDTASDIPLVFVLSTGSDPFGAFQRFAAEMGCTSKIQSISLGQGQGPVAEKMIGIAKIKGDWIFLQNCHLATSWMLSMERIIKRIGEESSLIHTDFRLFLSSMPSKSFPVSVLQNSVKVTNEPPKGLRANIKRAFTDITEDFFNVHELGQHWRTMIFGICMFHAVIQERKKFGPLGWNIMYEFNDSDRECALNTMNMFCSEGVIPWDALEYITGEITYGGRVTDYWDLRCLKTILKGFFASHTLEADYKYSESGIYYCPEYPAIKDYREFIDKLPLIEQPEIFGMHENANIAFQIKETQTIVLTILESQPRTASGDTGKSSDEIVYELSEVIQESIIPIIQSENPFVHLFKYDKKGRLPSLTTVLTQEIDRFNKLLKLIHSSLDNLQKAIKGFVVMSESLEEVFTAFINNQVPNMWAKKAYPSLKSLAGWVADLIVRIDFILFWYEHGLPPSFWLSGFFFPQGFLTGTLQTHARKYDLPIDQLKFDFKTTQILIDQTAIKRYHDENRSEVASLYGNLFPPEDGVNVHGLFLDAARWNLEESILQDQNPGEMNPPLPALILVPVIKMKPNDPRYICPLYKTSVRAGTLSTTGHSTNFVVAVLLPSEKPQSYWILMGTALLTQTNE